MSHVGQQYLAPNGWAALVRGRCYHYLAHCHDGHVRFVWFSDGPPRAHVEVLKLADFNDALKAGALVVAAHQASLPPWLEQYERDGQDISKLEDKHGAARIAKRTRTNEQEVNARRQAIAPLLENIDELLSSHNLLQQINLFARQSKPRLNEMRTRLWLFLYVAFGSDKWVLLPGRSKCGRKAVEVAGPGDFGRDSPPGRNARSHSTPEMRDKIIEVWKKKTKGNKPKLTQEKIIALIRTEGFGCKTRKVGDFMEFYHPHGQAFPTRHQVLYTLKKRIGLPAMQIALYGKERVRTRLRASLGSYSARVANLLERVEADAYHLIEVPCGPLDGNPMPPLVVVRIRCVVSGALVGIGFSIGGERARAYKEALFSMALPKKQFCKLFGIDIAEEDWPCQGMPSWIKVDRGPGSSNELIELFEDKIPIRELAPSHAGQSKPNIESSHPKSRKSDGPPSFIRTKETYVDLARKEIHRLIADNNRINVAARQTPNMLREHVFPTALSIWNYLDSRCRTSAHPMALDRAIKAFLEPTKFTVNGEGADLHGQLYRSDALSATGICDRAEVAGSTFEFHGYAPAICMRGAWLDIEGKLVWVDACLKIADDEQQLYLSLPELEELNKIRRLNRTLAEEHRQAVTSEAAQNYQDQSGHSWDSGTVQSGRANRKTAAATAENQAAKKAAGG